MAAVTTAAEMDEDNMIGNPFHAPLGGAAERQDTQHHDAPWHLVDADGFDIDPAAEGSMLMEAYLSSQLLLEGEEAQIDIADESDECCGGKLNISAEAMKKLQQMTCEANVPHHNLSIQKPATNSVEPVGDKNNSDPRHLQAAADEKKTESMGAHEYSREFSNASADEEWILEQILKRRPLRCTTYQKVYDEDDGLEVVSTTNTQYEYLCKWKWYAEPTWESRTVLEDELGLVAQITSFDENLLKRHTTHHSSNSRPISRFGAGDVQRIVGIETIMAAIQQQFTAANISSGKSSPCPNTFSLLRYAEVLNREVEERFLHRWRAGLDDVTPRVLFHGTRLVNIPSICATGFKIAGRSRRNGGVRIQNGASFGSGVYTAPTPRMSAWFSSSDLMFVCLGLVPSKPERYESRETEFLRKVVTDRGTMVIFHDEALVIPLFVIQYASVHNESGKSRRTLSSEEIAIVKGDMPPQLVPLGPLINGTYGTVDAWQRENNDSTTARANISVAAKDTIIEGAGPTKTFTKKMIKQLPRSIKDAYRSGSLKARRSS
ncbi:Hypothetical protein, putative [Bodo saltans]|uniref:Chromo domain-containing protein n=1 Tax=Bodo saltans TaxID=75058 RepID=A0A0S4IP79_BODSA|nr:Hypothetical protein, putative [Bodo saltans]|eukprot:CUF00817.1 Hypothetical protein, putative [Bodo saltans]